MRELYKWVLGAWAKESVGSLPVAGSVAVQAEASMLSPLKSMKTATTTTTTTETSLVDIVAAKLAESKKTSCSTLMMRPFVCLFITILPL